MFKLHPDLARDGIPMGRFDLCDVLMINDAAYPWYALVPRRANISDTFDLTADDHDQLWRESRAYGAAIMKVFKGEKLNVAALGNMTPQLHVHHIVRYKSDAAWPRPIWGMHKLTPYDPESIKKARDKLSRAQISGFKPV